MNLYSAMDSNLLLSLINFKPTRASAGIELVLRSTIRKDLSDLIIKMVAIIH